MDSSTSNNTIRNDALSSSSASFDEEWEEWDGSSPFWVHCVAGSMAGVAEHVLVYPLDTVRTHIQVCAACHFNPASHNASTQAAGMAKTTTVNNAKAVPGAILQQAAASASPKISKTISSSSSSNYKTASSKLARGGAGRMVGTVTGSSGIHNLSMMQAIRQLVSQQPLAVLEDSLGSFGVIEACVVSLFRRVLSCCKTSRFVA